MAELARVRTWAEALIRIHLDAEWTFAFDHAKTRAGLCNFTRKRISVSRYIAERSSDDDIHQVLLHEVAHAIAGPDAGHGAAWKRVCAEIGYEGGRTHDGPTPSELAPWRGVCPNGHESFRYRKPTRASSCGKCSRRFDPALRIVWSRQG